MSNKVIVLWSITVISLVLAIYLIGTIKKEELLYSKYEKDIKESVNKYIDDNGLTYPMELTSDILIDNGYLEEKLIVKKNECTANINAINDKDIKIEFVCDNIK